MKLVSALSHYLEQLKGRRTLVLLVILMLVGGYVRLWNLDGTLMFQGDQGRDALIVSRIFKEGDLVLIGPGSSVGGIYLGPFYYYFMLPFLWASYPSPVGPAVAVAVVSTLSIPLIFYVTQKVTHIRAAWIATLLFTFSAPLIEYARFSWNPNLTPTFSLLMLFFTYKAWQGHYRYWLLVALSFGILIQLHYLALVSGVAAGLIWLLQLRQIGIGKEFKHLQELLITTLGSLAIFGLTLIPLLAFDARRNWLNLNGFYQLFFKSDSFSAAALGEAGVEKPLYFEIPEVLEQVFIHNIFGLEGVLAIGLLAILLTTMIYFRKQIFHNNHLWLATIFVLVSLIGVLFFKGELHVHYLIYLFPIIFMLLGSCISATLERKVTWPIGLGLIALFFWANISHISLSNLSWTIHDAKRVSTFITEKLGQDERYVLVLLGPSKDYTAQNYRYFLSTTDKPALLHDQLDQAQTLVVINEERLPSITSSPVYEIQAFPEKTNEEVYTIPNGPNIHIFRKSAP